MNCTDVQSASVGTHANMPYDSCCDSGTDIGTQSMTIGTSIDVDFPDAQTRFSMPIGTVTIENMPSEEEINQKQCDVSN